MTARSSPTLGNLPIDKAPVVIHHRAFRAQSAQRCGPATEVAQILGRFGMRFHRMRRGQQVAKFDQRRHGSAARFGRALEDAIFVLETQRTHAAYVVNRQEEVEGVKRTVLDIPHQCVWLPVAAWRGRAG